LQEQNTYIIENTNSLFCPNTLKELDFPIAAIEKLKKYPGVSSVWQKNTSHATAPLNMVALLSCYQCARA
jgi:hypothetical protein